MASDVRLTVLSRALDQAQAVIEGVQPDRLLWSTPCPQWDVRRLVAHLVSGPAKFVEMDSGGQPDWASDPPVELAEAPATFRANADDLLRSWRN